MITVYGELYHNDFTRKPFTEHYCSLEALFQHLKKISHNFSDQYANRFPTLNDAARFGEPRYEWVSRISVGNEDNWTYRHCWIYQIDNENGTVYSTGRYTNGEKFCAKFVADWLADCQNRRNNNKPKFVEE